MRDTVAFLFGLACVAYGIAVLGHWVPVPTPEATFFVLMLAYANTIWRAGDE